MARSKTPWAATSVPTVRRQWCEAMDHTVAARVAQMQDARDQLATANAPTGSARRVREAIDRVSAAVSEMADDTAALADASMYWVSRDMVGVVQDAATGLPEWTPAAAIPAPTGLLCWARPVGQVPYGPGAESGGGHVVTWDATFWRTRADGLLQLVPFPPRSACRVAFVDSAVQSVGAKTPRWQSRGKVSLDGVAGGLGAHTVEGFRRSVTPPTGVD